MFLTSCQGNENSTLELILSLAESWKPMPLTFTANFLTMAHPSRSRSHTTLETES